MRHFRQRHDAPVALITITVMLGMIMAIIDATIVNVALPNIAGNLGATVEDVSWVATGYILASVITMPLNGWLTARFGRKNFYAGCVAIFTIASFLCGTAHSVWQLTFYRVLQGFGGGALQPTAQAILFESYPIEKRGSAMAIFGLGAMVGPAVGPTLGGWLIDNASWPLIFLINIPIGIAALIMTYLFIPNPSYIEKPKRGVDWSGLALMTAGLASLQYVLERGQHDDWWNSNTIIFLLLLAIVTLVVFIFKMLREREPLVDLKVFRIGQFTIANILGVVTGFGLFGTMLIMPLFFQNVMGFTALGTGLALLPGALSSAVAMPIVGRMVGRVDARLMVGAGLVMFGTSAWLLGGLTQDAGYWDVFYPRVLQGFSLGFLFVPLTTIMLNGVPKGEIANASGIATLVRQLGGSLGIAVLTTLLQRRQAFAFDVLAGGVTQSHGLPTAALTLLVNQQSLVIAYDYLFRVSALVFFACLPLVLLLRSARTPITPAAAPAIPEAAAAR